MASTNEHDSVSRLESEVENLHLAMEARGVNSRGTCDLFGRKFAVPADADHKATQDPCLTTCGTCAKPHMRAFHTSWFGFFASFFSTFAAAPLGAYIKPDLDLTKGDIRAANTCSVGGTIIFRLIMGWICDKVGPRRGLGFLLLGVTPAIIGIMFVQDAAGFIACRCIIGFSLATFVACQVWCSQMFSKNVVGIANATAAGWGNLGGGVTNLLMPYIFLLFLAFTDDENSSWRLCYIVPLVLHILGGLSVLSARDLPDGNYAELESSGAKQKADGTLVLKLGTSNVNAWLLTITYGWCFGIELTMNNVAAKYFYDYQGLTPQIAGVIASIFGLMNLFARSLGGMLSDSCAKKWGMRGRLWSCWIVQTLEGMMCIFLGLVTIDYDSPYDKPSVWGQYNIGEEDWRYAPYCPAGSNCPAGWVEVDPYCRSMGFNTTKAAKDMKVKVCGVKSLKLDQPLKDCLGVGEKLILLEDRTTYYPFGTNTTLDCIKNSDTIFVSIIIVLIFSIFVQMAEGLHFGIVPYVSRPALGIVSGMVGAGGNLGSVIALNWFFTDSMRSDEAIIQMGIAIIGFTLLLWGVHFPEYGSMFFAKGAISYDPQLIPVPAGVRGADEMDMGAHKGSKTEDNAA